MSDLIGRTIPVLVDGREVLGTIGLAGRNSITLPPNTIVVRYDLNGESDWTFTPESLLRKALEEKKAIYA